MITRSAPTWHTEDWQILLSGSIREPEALWRRLRLPPALLPAAWQGHQAFPVTVPEPYLEKIRPGEPDDPLLRQVLPVADETREMAGYVADPLQERQTRPRPGLLHKYQSRVLLVLSGACAVNCRYCFRRHFPYEDNRLSSGDFASISAYLQVHPEVNEVILSGGDPLVVSNARLGRLVELLEAIPSLQRLRIHSRLPVVIPQRVDAGLLAALERTRLAVVLVTHSNHPRELDPRFGQAMGQLRERGVHLLNQAVLLRGVNDSPDTLVDHSEALFQHGVMPYYLHLLDPVAGAHHFDVPEAEARPLMAALHRRLPGFLIPRLVREVPGKGGKTLIDLHLS
ncbi:MAG: EF-P beta-lysylation protein EpmB [Pseudomonadota bacterium]|nr:EF-P beta-lysylation protein EpmB [Pseudomonadota bacterium]